MKPEVLRALANERQYQKSKWGKDCDKKEVASFILFMEHHLEHARKLASVPGPILHALDEIRKVTALGVACMETHGAPDRYRDV